MIPRYNVLSISEIWSDQSKYQYFLQAELAIMQALEGGPIPRGTSEKIRKLAVINPSRIDEIEQSTRHDVIAFCTSITEKLPTELAKYFHYGVTSSDIIDTALSLQIRDSLTEILPRLTKLNYTLLARAQETKEWVAMGRSHGMYAEPLSFGQKLLGHWCELRRREQDYNDFFKTQLTGQFSGAVGNYTIIGPDHEKTATQILNLKVESVSTQVIPRDRLAKLLSLGALTACALERLSIEIRHLHRSEVAEVAEGFSQGQKGSSTMPHKKNPIATENISGISRVLRSHAHVGFDNTLLWHERDISHSSAERLMLPDHFGLLAYAFERLEKTIKNLEINRSTIEGKVFSNFTYLSSYYLHRLIDLYPMKREELYAIVQRASFATAQGIKQSPEIFHNNLAKELQNENVDLSEVKSPNVEEIKRIYLNSVDAIFQRARSEYS